MSTAATTIAGDVTSIDAATVVGSIEALAPRFRARAARTESECVIPRESIDELIGAGMFRMLVPRAFGGLGCTIRQLIDATAAVSAGCPSTAWCAGQSAWSALVIAQGSLEVQQAVWADGPDVLTGSTIAGLSARVVPGGYVLSGKGPFTSNAHYAQWLFPAAGVQQAEGPPVLRFFILPASATTVINSWDTVAMRGTGSNTVVLDDVFVPDAFSISLEDVRESTGPGTAFNTDSIFRVPWAAVVPLIYGAVLLGAVRAAYEDVRSSLATKRLPNGLLQADSEVIQMQLGTVSAKIDTAQMLLHASAECADSGLEYTLESRAMVSRDAAYAVTILLEAINSVLELGGTSAFGRSSIIQQAWRDGHLAAAHQAVNRRFALSRFGRMQLGIPDSVQLAIY